jgi:hypothetical protein
LDSATVFLFGSNVHSLGAPLPHAHNSPHREISTKPHSSDKFAKAFSQAQHQIALRARLTTAWPLMEFWKDKTEDATRYIYGFINPILEDALSKKAMVEKKSPINEDDGHSETLVDHLVQQTTGKQARVASENLSRYSSSIVIKDPVIIRDEILK